MYMYESYVSRWTNTRNRCIDSTSQLNFIISFQLKYLNFQLWHTIISRWMNEWTDRWEKNHIFLADITGWHWKYVSLPWTISTNEHLTFQLWHTTKVNECMKGRTEDTLRISSSQHNSSSNIKRDIENHFYLVQRFKYDLSTSCCFKVNEWMEGRKIIWRTNSLHNFLHLKSLRHPWN